MARTYDKTKIHEALELLNAAAAEEQSELQDMIGDRSPVGTPQVGDDTRRAQRALDRGNRQSCRSQS